MNIIIYDKYLIGFIKTTYYTQYNLYKHALWIEMSLKVKFKIIRKDVIVIANVRLSNDNTRQNTHS